MNYLTCQQAAEKWGVGARIVRRWCQQGRIFGAKRAGKSYLLPPDSVPPADRRFSEEPGREQIRLAMLMDPDLPSKDSFEQRFMEYTELNYQGYPEQAELLLAALLSEAKADSYRLPVMIQLFGIENHLGQPKEAEKIFRNITAIVSGGGHPAYERLLAVFFDKKPVLPATDVASELLPFLLLRSTRNTVMGSITQPERLNLHHLEILGRVIDGSGSELVQAYFHSLLAVAALVAEDEALQRYHEEKAREIILRRRWYLLFAEYYYYLDWQIERYIDDADVLAFIQELTQKLFESYIRCAVTETDFSRPELMTPELLKVAVLRSLGKSNAEIARCMNTSAYFIRKYIDELAICTDNADGTRMKEIVHSVMWFM